MEEFFLQNQSIKKYLIANKIDLLENEKNVGKKLEYVSSQEGEEFSRKYGFSYFELSTKNMGDNKFDNTFIKVIEEILPYVKQNFMGNNKRILSTNQYMYCVPNKGCSVCNIF